MNALFGRTLSRVSARQFVSPVFSAQRAAVPVMTATRAFSIQPVRYQQALQNEKSKDKDSAVSADTADLTPLKLEGDLYAVVNVHNNPFLITKGDKMVLPYNLKTAEVGDVLNFHDVTTIGSRNYTFVGEPIDTQLFSIKATVLEKTRLPMRVTEVTKRRQRKVKHQISKPQRTILRVTELKLN